MMSSYRKFCAAGMLCNGTLQAALAATWNNEGRGVRDLD
jgi:hypothetical protein